jgi:hypothetical protein
VAQGPRAPVRRVRTGPGPLIVRPLVPRTGKPLGVASSLYGGRTSSIACVTGPTPYLHFPGTARAALTFYGEVFGCTVQLHTCAEVNRTDGPADAIAHGYPGYELDYQP